MEYIWMRALARYLKGTPKTTPIQSRMRDFAALNPYWAEPVKKLATFLEKAEEGLLERAEDEAAMNRFLESP